MRIAEQFRARARELLLDALVDSDEHHQSELESLAIGYLSLAERAEVTEAHTDLDTKH